MAKVVCEAKDCIYRSKHKLKTVTHKHDGSACYGCMLDFVSLVDLLATEIEESLGRNVVECAYYEPNVEGE